MAEIDKMNDSSVRVALRMPQDAVAALAGVCRPTIARYELDPLAVHDTSKRTVCSRVYAELRRLLSRPWTQAA